MNTRQTLLLASGLAVLVTLCTSTKAASTDPIPTRLVAEFCPDARVGVFETQVFVSAGETVLHVKTTRDDVRPILEKRFPKFRIEVLELPDSKALHGLTHGFVRVPVATLYGKPAYTGAVQTQVVHGDPLRILESAGSFLRVRVPDGYIAWIPREQVSLLDDTAFRKVRAQVGRITLEPETPVLREPDSKSNCVAVLASGSLLFARGDSRHGWQPVSLADNRLGYVQENQIADPALERKRWNALQRDTRAYANALKDLAMRFVGRSYQWAGASSFAMDCSGFVQTVFRRMGWILPRDTDQQAKTGAVVKAPYSAGDLLFFGRRGPNGMPDSISHVALSLGGNRFIHARGDVHTASFDPKDADFDAYERSRFLKAVRPAFERLQIIR